MTQIERRYFCVDKNENESKTKTCKRACMCVRVGASVSLFSMLTKWQCKNTLNHLYICAHVLFFDMLSCSVLIHVFHSSAYFIPMAALFYAQFQLFHCSQVQFRLRSLSLVPFGIVVRFFDRSPFTDS